MAHGMITIIDYELYIGDNVYANGKRLLPKNMSIVNCTKHLPFPTGFDKSYCYRIPIDDKNNDENNNLMYDHLKSACDFIHNQIKQERYVLVHCQQGLSRSPSVIVAYLMNCKHMSLEDAIDLVRNKKKGALRTLNFEPCLQKWQNVITTPTFEKDCHCTD